jgi:glycosyltransferase involved in cell wall biosynthesis/predicted O-methyltransferase YrrM
MTDLSGPRARLLTAFGTVLYVDAASGELRHGPVESSPANAWFVAKPACASPHHRGWLIPDPAGTGAGEPIACREDGSRSISRIGASNGPAIPTVLELIPLERGLVAFAAGGRFLSAIPGGRVSLPTLRCSTWELFVASEAWCTDVAATHEGGVESAAASFDRKAIASYAIHPLIRTRAGTRPKGAKLLIYGYPSWSHGRVYYDLCKHLHCRGYVVDVLDWQRNHVDYIGDLIAYYDLFMTALDGVGSLVDVHGVPYDRIIALSHHELDMRMLVEQKGLDVFHRFANFGVVSDFLYCRSLMQGVPRIPMVASLGVNYSEFCTKIPDRLATVGYASSMSVKTYGIEWKRGELAERAAREAGLAFKVAGSTANQISFHDMPEFYRSVDAVVLSSISEGDPMSVMEAAAAGRLVIGTPVGDFPLKPYRTVAPVEAEKFTTFAVAALRYYKENPAFYVDKCHSIQEAAKQFDWQHSIEEWVALIESARPVAAASRHGSGGQDVEEYQFTADWFSGCIPVWAQLIEQLKPARILEIGSYEGRSTCYLIENAAKLSVLEIHCVDTWEGGIEHDSDAMREVERRFDHNVALARRRAAHAASLRKIKKPSTRALAELIARQEAPFDLVYVDGSHKAPDVLADAVLAFQLLRVGGIMIFDDYLWRLEPIGREDPLNMPKPAIDSFINLFQRKLRVISGLPLWQLYIEKKA